MHEAGWCGGGAFGSAFSAGGRHDDRGRALARTGNARPSIAIMGVTGAAKRHGASAVYNAHRGRDRRPQHRTPPAIQAAWMGAGLVGAGPTAPLCASKI
jgi:hypothetical protein